MECLVGSIGVHLDAEFGFILTNKSFSSMFMGSKAAKSFFFHHILSLYLNTTFSTGEHNLALYTDHWNKVLSPGPWSWISLVCCIQLHKSRVLVDIKQLHFEFCNAITVCGYLFVINRFVRPEEGCTKDKSPAHCRSKKGKTKHLWSILRLPIQPSPNVGCLMQIMTF